MISFEWPGDRSANRDGKSEQDRPKRAGGQRSQPILNGGQGRHRTTGMRIFSPGPKTLQAFDHTAILAGDFWNIRCGYAQISP